MKIDVKYAPDEHQNAEELLTAIKTIFPLAKVTRSSGDKYLHLFIVFDYRWKNRLR